MADDDEQNVRKPNAYADAMVERSVSEDRKLVQRFMKEFKQNGFIDTIINDINNELAKGERSYEGLGGMLESIRREDKKKQELRSPEDYASFVRSKATSEGKIDYKTDEDIKVLYDNLKDGILATQNDLRLMKTPAARAATIGRNVVAFIGNLLASTGYIAGTAIEMVGQAIHYTPAAYIINRIPYITKKATFKEKFKDTGISNDSYQYREDVTYRENFLERIGKGIKGVTRAVSDKAGLTPITTALAKAKAVLTEDALSDKIKVSPSISYRTKKPTKREEGRA